MGKVASTLYGGYGVISAMQYLLPPLEVSTAFLEEVNVCVYVFVFACAEKCRNRKTKS